MRQKVKTNLFPKNKTKLFKIMQRQKKKKKCRIHTSYIKIAKELAYNRIFKGTFNIYGVNFSSNTQLYMLSLSHTLKTINPTLLYISTIEWATDHKP